MMVLENMPQNLVQKIYSIVYDYLWQGKKAKLSMDIVKLAKEEGWLRLVD